MGFGELFQWLILAAELAFQLMNLGSRAWHALDEKWLLGVRSHSRIIKLVLGEGGVRLVLAAETTFQPIPGQNC
jgi:hypothetical protein